MQQLNGQQPKDDKGPAPMDIGATWKGKGKGKGKKGHHRGKGKSTFKGKGYNNTYPYNNKGKGKAMVPSVKEIHLKVHQKATPAKASHHLPKEKERTTPQHAINVANKITLPGTVEFPSTTTTRENKATCQIQHTMVQRPTTEWPILVQSGFDTARLCQHITTCVATTTTGIIQFTGHQLCRRGPHCWHRRSPRKLRVKDIIVWGDHDRQWSRSPFLSTLVWNIIPTPSSWRVIETSTANSHRQQHLRLWISLDSCCEPT